MVVYRDDYHEFEYEPSCTMTKMVVPLPCDDHKESIRIVNQIFALPLYVIIIRF